MSFFPSISSWVSIWSAEILCDHLFAWASKTQLQHTSLPCPSLTPRVHPNSCPLSQWCHPTISCSVIPFSSCPQSFPSSGSFHMSQLFTSGGQSIGASASTSVLSINIQDWFPLEESSPTLLLQPQFKIISSSALNLLYGPTLTSIHEDRKSVV